MKSRKIEHRFLTVLIVVYVLVLIVAFNIQHLSNQNLLKEIKSNVTKAIDAKSGIIIDKHYYKTPLEVYILKNNELVYSTLPRHAVYKYYLHNRNSKAFSYLIRQQNDTYIVGIDLYRQNDLILHIIFMSTVIILVILVSIKVYICLKQKQIKKKISNLDQYSNALETYYHAHSASINELLALYEQQKQVDLKKTEILGSLIHNLKSRLVNNRLILSELDQNLSLNNLNELKNNNEVIIRDVKAITDIAFNQQDLDLETKEHFKLEELLMETYLLFKRQIEDKGLYLDFIIDPESDIYANKITLKIIVYNLFSNICAYALNNSQVVIESKIDQDNINISFFNECLDLSQENVNRLTKLYYSTTKESDGNGTGLYTVSKLIKKQKGKVKIEKQDNGIAIILSFKNVHDSSKN